jgi:plastocyanin
VIDAVSIFDFGYMPAAATVSVGTQITWTNTGAVPHTVTFEDGPDSGLLESGGTFQHTFETAGTFGYICTIHPAMTGTITVED